MNLQQQLFNAKLKAAADTKARQDMTDAGLADIISGIGVGARAAVNPAPYLGPMGAGPMMLGTPATPGASPMDSLRAAMQANPGAAPRDLALMAAAMQELNKPVVPSIAAQRLAWDREKYGQTQITKDQVARKAILDNVMGEFSNVRTGALPFYAPSGDGFANIEDPAARLQSIFPVGAGPIVQDQFDESGEKVGTATTSPTDYAKLGGDAGWYKFVEERIKPVVAAMQAANMSPTKIKQVLAMMSQQGFNPQAGQQSTRFNYNAAISAIPSEIVRLMQQKPMRSISDVNATLTRGN
jgi:hypothetical protein